MNNILTDNWLLILAAIAAFVILSGRMTAISGWIKDNFSGGGSAVPGELTLIANLVAAAKLITDPAQKKVVCDACIACFTGWLKKEIPE